MTTPTVPDSRPAAIRLRALRQLVEAVEGDAALFYRLYRVDGAPWFGDILAAGPGSDDLPVREMSNIPALAGSAAASPGDAPWHRGYWTVRMPLPGQRNCFSRFDDDVRREDLMTQPIWARFYEPAGLDDQLRAFVYDGGAFVGWIGAFRQGRGARFRDTDAESARVIGPDIVSLITAADQLRAVPDETPTYATFDPTGRLRAATEAAKAYLDRPRTESLGRIVRRLDEGSRYAPSSFFWEGVQLRVVRLDEDDGVRYLVIVDRAILPRISPLARLTARQRQVCEGAAVGCTAGEIARHLGISEYTVKDHLKRAYARLEIGSRAELARRWHRWTG